MLAVLVSGDDPGADDLPDAPCLRAPGWPLAAKRGRSPRTALGAGAPARASARSSSRRRRVRVARRRRRASSTSSRRPPRARGDRATRPTGRRPCARVERRRGGGGVPRPADRASRRSRGRPRGEVMPQKIHVLLSQSSAACFSALSRSDPGWSLARLCRAAVGDVRRVLAELPGGSSASRSPASARAGTRRRRSTRRPRTRSSRGSRRCTPGRRVHLVSEELGERRFGSGRDRRGGGRSRSTDRQRQARHPVLLALGRGGRGADDGGRRLRLRLRLRLGRGVDGRRAARARASTAARSARRPKDRDRDPRPSRRR